MIRVPHGAQRLAQRFESQVCSIGVCSSLLALAICLTGTVAVAQTARAESLPIPAAGKEAVTVLALIDYQFQGCELLSEGITTRWDRMAGSPEHQEQRIRDWILQSHTGEMASLRKAGDLAEELLDQVQPKIRREAGASLRRMAEHTGRLCDLVAVPVAPFESFQLETLETVEKIEREERELGRLVLSDEKRMAEAITPYLPTVQMAAVEAEGQYMDFLETEKPKEPEGPTPAQLMQHWHDEIYAPATLPAKRALAAYLKAQRERNRGVGSACRDLSRALIPILRDTSNVFATVPDPAVIEPLRRAYAEMQALAVDCNAARVQRAQEHLDKTRFLLAEAAAVLAPYGIAP